MASATQSSPAVELKSLNRVYSIPLIADSLNTIHASLLNNSYTRSPYNAGLMISERAYSISQPLQARLAPVLLRADDFANKGLDVVQSRCPYPFETPTQNIYADIKTSTDRAVGVANKTASDIAQDLDKRLTPLVNRYESVAGRLSSHSSRSSEASEVSEGTATVNATAESQVERAYKITLDLRNSIYTVSSEQIKHLQIPGAVVQKVTEVVYDINTQIANSFVNAKGKGAAIANQTQAKVQQLAGSIIQELEKIQSTSAALPAHIQASLRPVQERISSTISSISSIAKSDAAIGEKTAKIREVVQHQVQPLLETALDSVHSYVEASRKYMYQTAEKVETRAKDVTTNGVNGIEH